MTAKTVYVRLSDTTRQATPPQPYGQSKLWHLLSASLTLAPSSISPPSPALGGGWLPRVFPCHPRFTGVASADNKSAHLRLPGTRSSGLGCHSAGRGKRRPRPTHPKPPNDRGRRKAEGNIGQDPCTLSPLMPDKSLHVNTLFLCQLAPGVRPERVLIVNRLSVFVVQAVGWLSWAQLPGGARGLEPWISVYPYHTLGTTLVLPQVLGTPATSRHPITPKKMHKKKTKKT